MLSKGLRGIPNQTSQKKLSPPITPNNATETRRIPLTNQTILKKKENSSVASEITLS